MARRKIKEIEEEVSSNDQGNIDQKRVKPMVIERQSRTKRKVEESESKDDVPKPKKKIAPRKKSVGTNSRKFAMSKKEFCEEIEQEIPEDQNDITSKPKPRKKSLQTDPEKATVSEKMLNDQEEKHICKGQLSDHASKPKNKPRPRKKSVKANSRNGIKSETESKIKKAKVVLKRMKLDKESDSENEHSSPNSMDSGILLEPMLKGKNCSLTFKSELPSSSKHIESSGIGDDDSSSESEWEEVEENVEQNLDDYKPDIPKEGVEITIDCPDLNIRKRRNKQFDEMECIRLYINRGRKEVQLNIHKMHLLCLLAHGFFVNNMLNSPILKGIALSLIPPDIFKLTCGKKIDKIDCEGIKIIVKWFCNSFSLEAKRDSFLNISESMVSYFENQKCLNVSEYNLMFIVLARTLGFKTRFCISLYALSHKAQNLIKKSNPKQSEKKIVLSIVEKIGDATVSGMAGKSSKAKSEKKKLCKQEPKKKRNGKKISQVKDQPSCGEKKKHNRPRRSTEKSYKMSSDESVNDLKDEDFEDSGTSEDDFEERKPVKRTLVKTPKQKSNRKVLSTDSEPSSSETSGFKSDKVVCWAEVFSKPDKQWISIECVNNVINKPYDIEENIPQPVTYILAYDNESYVKDVTKRYCSNYMTSTIKLRADTEWWEETLLPFLPPNSKLDKEEEKNLEAMLINKPLPTTVAGFKNHPLYALKRHLLKFEGIYPPDAAPVGFMRAEPVYARECVCQLHSRETWLKDARVVRIGEEPYKIVKARPKWDRMAGVMRTDLPLEIFGFWQTIPYDPPIAVDGKVPRNEYGNVELFKPCMLPKGTVHLQLPGLNRVAKKLGIDCSAAVVGFDGHKGSVHAVFDGFIVCEEFKDTILAAWEEEQENTRKREEEKREKRIYGNWRKLIRGLLIRERIKLKYDVK